MSNRPSRSPSPSNSSKPESSQDIPAQPKVSGSLADVSDIPSDLGEAPQHIAGLRSQSTPNLFSSSQAEHPSTNASPAYSGTPQIVVTGSPETAETDSFGRQGRSLVYRHRTGNSSSQPPRRASTPYTRPRSRSQPREAPTATASAMSSASSSPGNTSTAGATSGSSGNPSYQLPYAPFPYPMPANARGGQGQQGSGSGK
ncbi:hypothetical protein BS50DRAFT_10928 [Corynespora cassiicola Philippines]|uniref:Uncharacterized protein n=1 Tax=Corynespora cassiicola Philippines TaxID=1448308 RepID=A0A2T2P9B0_CORCC|nr:hypothetical protein BS50DRAFT_10928 [Corynespora cassiicola Philippines]